MQKLRTASRLQHRLRAVCSCRDGRRGHAGRRRCCRGAKGLDDSDGWNVGVGEARSMRGCLCCCVQGASAASSASSVGGREAEAGSRARALPLAIRWDNLVPSLRRVRGSSSPRAAAGLPWAAKGPWWPRYHAPAPSGRAAPIDYGASAQSQAAAISFAGSNGSSTAATTNVVHMCALELGLRFAFCRFGLF